MTLIAGVGFGGTVTGTAPSGTTTTLVPVNDKATLKAALAPLATAGSGSTIIELDRPSGQNFYDFKDLRSDKQTFVIKGKNITIRAKAGARVVLKSIQFLIDVDNADNILIQDLNFRSDRDKNNARDAIVLDSPDVTTTTNGVTTVTDPLGANNTTDQCHVRITHCSFDGYYDIAIDSHTRPDRPLLLATIDHCLFYDSAPGQAPSGSSFVNRGAINIDSNANVTAGSQRTVGHAYVTVTRNVFVDQWRRSPRIAVGNFGHIFNNLLYRWGFGDDSASKSTWVGMTIGGGDMVPNGIALIQANRFIPWKKKVQLNQALNIGANTTVDIGLTAAPPAPQTSRYPNRFDDKDGNAIPNAAPPTPTPGGFATLRLDEFNGIALPTPVEATGTTGISWTTVVTEAVPAGISDDGITDLRSVLGTS